MNPQVVEALREDGKRRCALRPKPLQAIRHKLPQRQRVERGVTWQVDGLPLRLRLISRWNPQTTTFCSLLTNLAAERSPLDTICRAYPWRWQGAWLCKAWQSYANLPAFDTEHSAMVEGLIWAALAAAALQRFVAQMTPLLAKVPMSTRQVAMGAMHV